MSIELRVIFRRIPVISQRRSSPRIELEEVDESGATGWTREGL